jgi:hypothetical protein
VRITLQVEEEEMKDGGDMRVELAIYSKTNMLLNVTGPTSVLSCSWIFNTTQQAFSHHLLDPTCYYITKSSPGLYY